MRAKSLPSAGETGSGKSSLLATLLQLLDLDSGSIVLDGIDLAHVIHDTVGGHLMAVPQTPVFYPGTLRSNLVLAETTIIPAATDAEIISVLERVCLWAVITLRDCNLDTDVALLALSEGQK
jgi:ABC-type multidrug transport system fused ATPase/permease subunit